MTEYNLYLVCEGNVENIGLDGYKLIEKEICDNFDIFVHSGLTVGGTWLDKDNHVVVLARSKEEAKKAADKWDKGLIDVGNHVFQGETIGAIKLKEAI